MDRNELIQKITEIEGTIPTENSDWTYVICHSFYITTLQFIRTYVGQDSEFYITLRDYSSDKAPGTELEKAWAAKKVLKSLKEYLGLNLEIKETDKYNIRMDIISDFLLQAINLANDKKYHPAAAGILMGASLEEFIKKLAERHEIELKGVRMTIDPIATKLYESKIISKQDLKDIISWTGIRNEATHGNFSEVDDRKRIQNAIEGVNLFMRNHQTLQND